MHSMPAVAVHPSGKWMALQSMDNQVPRSHPPLSLFLSHHFVSFSLSLSHSLSLVLSLHMLSLTHFLLRSLFQIYVFSAMDRFRQNGKKQFGGHLVAGYACQPDFSPDGRYLISGDSEGKLVIWDWKVHTHILSLSRTMYGFVFFSLTLSLALLLPFSLTLSPAVDKAPVQDACPRRRHHFVAVAPAREESRRHGQLGWLHQNLAMSLPS